MFCVCVTVDDDCYTGSCNTASGKCVFDAMSEPTGGFHRRRLHQSMCPAGKSLCPVGNTGRAAGQLSLSGYEVS
jgi:hypothetical protein